MTLAEAIHTKRLQAGWTQAELAARVGLSRPMISAIEVGERRPSTRALARLLRELGLSWASVDFLDDMHASDDDQGPGAIQTPTP